MIKTILNIILEKILNLSIKLDPSLSDFLSRHRSAVLGMHITDLDFKIFALFLNERIYLYSHYETTPTTLICSDSFSLLKQLFSEKASVQDLLIEGDINFAQDFKKTLKHLSFDWEEYLAFFSGDIIAHQFCLMVKKFIAFNKSIFEKTNNDVVEFIQEEKKLLPTKLEIEDLYEDINQFKYRVERLTAKYQRIIT